MSMKLPYISGWSSAIQSKSPKAMYSSTICVHGSLDKARRGYSDGGEISTKWNSTRCSLYKKYSEFSIVPYCRLTLYCVLV